MKPITKILVTLVLSGLICQGAFMLYSRGFKKFYYATFRNFTELYEKSDTHEILFIGSSRMRGAVYPPVIDSICHVNSFNGGVDGGNMVEFKTTLDGYLLHHPAPRLIVLGIDLHSFVGTQKFSNQIRYYPFMDNKRVDQALNDNGHPTALLKAFPFLIFTQLDDYIRANALRGLVGSKITEVQPGTKEYKGFFSRIGSIMEMAPGDTTLITVEVSDQYVGYLNDIVKTCKSKGITLLFDYVPEYGFISQRKHVSNSKEVFAIISNIAVQNNIPFWRHDSLDICADPGKFADTYHLNQKGAMEYSAFMAHTLNEIK